MTSSNNEFVVETLALSPLVFDWTKDETHKENEWYLRLCLLRGKPDLAKAGLKPEENNIALINAKLVAGRRQCIAGALNIIRDLHTRRKGECFCRVNGERELRFKSVGLAAAGLLWWSNSILALKELTFNNLLLAASSPSVTAGKALGDDASVKKQKVQTGGEMMGSELGDALDSSLSSLLPFAMWPKKHGSAGAPHEKFFSIQLLTDAEPVLVARLDKQGTESGGDDSFLTVVRKLAAALPASEHEQATRTMDANMPDKERLQRAFDLAASELKDIDKAITIRVAAKDCM